MRSLAFALAALLVGCSEASGGGGAETGKCAPPEGAYLITYTEQKGGTCGDIASETVVYADNGQPPAQNAALQCFPAQSSISDDGCRESLSRQCNILGEKPEPGGGAGGKAPEPEPEPEPGDGDRPVVGTLREVTILTANPDGGAFTGTYEATITGPNACKSTYDVTGTPRLLLHDQPHPLRRVEQPHAVHALGWRLRLREPRQVAPFPILAADVHVRRGNHRHRPPGHLAEPERCRRARDPVEPRHVGDRQVPRVLQERPSRHDDRRCTAVREPLDVLAAVVRDPKRQLRQLVRDEPRERAPLEAPADMDHAFVELRAVRPVRVGADDGDDAAGERDGPRRVLFVNAGSAVNPGGDVVGVQASIVADRGVRGPRKATLARTLLDLPSTKRRGLLGQDLDLFGHVCPVLREASNLPEPVLDSRVLARLVGLHLDRV